MVCEGLAEVNEGGARPHASARCSGVDSSSVRQEARILSVKTTTPEADTPRGCAITVSLLIGVGHPSHGVGVFLRVSASNQADLQYST